VLVTKVVGVTEPELLEPVTGLPGVLLVLTSDDGTDPVLLEDTVTGPSELDELEMVGKGNVSKGRVEVLPAGDVVEATADEVVSPKPNEELATLEEAGVLYVDE
jgi:hypothetical protein